jgi:hypothetical protein
MGQLDSTRTQPHLVAFTREPGLRRRLRHRRHHLARAPGAAPPACAAKLAPKLIPRRSGTSCIWESAKFVTGFSRWVKGQAQGLEPGAFKLWVNWIQLAHSPPPRVLRAFEPRVVPGLGVRGVGVEPLVPVARVDPQTRTPIGPRRNEATSLVHTYRADQWASCKAAHNPARREARSSETAAARRRRSTRRATSARRRPPRLARTGRWPPCAATPG